MNENQTCEAFGRCGGCQYLNESYDAQLKRKYKAICDLYPGERVLPVVGMDCPYHYRHKVQVAAGLEKGRVVTGNFKTGTRKLVPVESCLLEDEGADAIIADVRKIANRYHMVPYDFTAKTGFLKFILVRKGYATGEYMVVIVTNGVNLARNNFKKELLKNHPEIKTLVQNINTRTDGMVLADRQEVFYGPGFIVDELLGKRFRISANSFYQVNPAQTEKLYSIALGMADLSGKTVLDAYCGTGTIGILASDAAKAVYGVEINGQAVRDARVNARLNGVTNVEFICDDAGSFLLGGASPDVVIMDPPRNGSTPAFLNAVAEAGVGEVVYISCGPDTQARDIALLKEKGYRVEKIVPVDLFPWTEHVETIVLLQRENS